MTCTKSLVLDGWALWTFATLLVILLLELCTTIVLVMRGGKFYQLVGFMFMLIVSDVSLLMFTQSDNKLQRDCD